MVGRGRSSRWRPASLALLAAIGVLAAPGVGAVAQPSDDPFRAEQWNLDRVRVDEAWRTSRGAGAVVAVVDTGVALDHPDLYDRLLTREDGSVVGVDLVDDDLDPTDAHGHGTLVAGVIAATAGNGRGIAGVAPEASIMPVRVLAADGSGSSEVVGRGIRWAVDHGADVINVSLEAVAAADGDTRAPGVPTDAVRYADEHGVLVVAAAGNRPGAAAAYPEDSPIVLVGAVDRSDQATRFSAVGRHDGFVAPGVDIVSTWCRRTARGCDVSAAPYGVAEGTSFAAPHVSAVAALLSAAGYDAAGIRERLAAGAVDLGAPGPDRQYGAGRVDAAASLDGAPPARARSTSPTPEPPPVPADEPAPTAVPDPEPVPAVERPEGAAGDDGDPDVAEVAPPEADPPPAVEVPDVTAEPLALDDLGAEADTALPADDDGPLPVAIGLEATGADDAPGVHRWLELIAGGLLAVAMLAWSRVARAEH